MMVTTDTAQNGCKAVFSPPAEFLFRPGVVGREK